MAANAYYNSSNTFSPNATSHQQSGTIGGASPPPPAPPDKSTHSISPVTSPFDDPNNRYNYPSESQQHLVSGGAAPAGYQGYNDDTTYHGAGAPSRYDPPAQYGQSHDPFADQNAIQLQNQGKMGEHSNPYGADPENHIYTGPPNGGGYPDKRRRKKKPFLKRKITWVVYILTAVQIGVFVGELIRNAILTKTPIQLKPQFNIMIGPSPYVLINMGARYPPCMHNIRGVTDHNEMVYWNCPNTTSQEPADNHCSLQELCGMGSGVPEQTYPTPFDDRSHEPNQWWRFITPIFLHAGLIHIGFNMLLQVTLGRDMEKEIGPLRFALVYFSAGIFGNVLGGNYAAENLPSVGASGSLFGILALVLLDLLYNWSSRPSPVKDLLFLILDICIAFVLGLLPGLDNFAHIGGFLCGLVLGICLMHSPQALRERIGTDEPPYASVHNADNSQGADGTKPAFAIPAIVKQPVGFFKGRKPFWWAWWIVRAGALVAVFIGFILLLRNFYEFRNECSWCYRLSCLPVRDWCENQHFDLDSTSENPSRMMIRELFGSAAGPVDLGAAMAAQAFTA
ncbi:rhomboid-domain-containing protein [Aaosphaeria arxii CBS 175.79]|uniref:Rhomboid-type serine protease n=1 Tax=Aaosphaeria arxii CBS 175.79 TaxID=1450172 RepID=A0A6A5XP77_9PLEO|nr:rhomboid-domain-containing protein [Aaosphaeria arxii CBS 175.79]KAF2015048.1 rhomboid-domain-containing protein [Aaosphaeria arxii CBS 175.79]